MVASYRKENVSLGGVLDVKTQVNGEDGKDKDMH